MSLPGPDGHPILMGGVSNTPRKYYPPPSGIGRSKGTKHATAPMKPTKTDDFIMDTNSSSIVSKRSVEKLYYPGQKEYFRYFVRKFQRRSPLINRGYWLRMKAVDSVIRKFLSENEGRKKLVVNLGCGYDPNPFEYLGRQPELCKDVTFVDVDYPQLMHKKYETIKANEPLHSLMPDLELQPKGSTVIARSEKYLAVGCDLRELDKLEAVLRSEFDMAHTPVSILFTAEVSVAYMTLEAANDVFEWATRFDDVRFCLLEQQIPDGRDHPFAQTMLKHFEKLRTPLHAVGTVEQMTKRFRKAGWPAQGLDIRSLWELWADPEFLTSEQRMDLDKIEPFDEWEEFALFGSHYFLLDAKKTPETRRSLFQVKEQSAEEVQGSGEALACLPLQGTPSHRRFAAVLPAEKETDVMGLHGGLGTRERLNNCSTYTSAEKASELISPSLPVALMCHTTTRTKKGECLLVGGRSSPDKASAACWYRKDGAWSKVHDLPEGRYRHCAISTQSGVVVFGGKNGRGEVLNDWLLWTTRTGWTKIEATGPVIEPRFGAAMSLLHRDVEEGVIVGGLRRDGTVINDHWKFQISVHEGGIEVVLEDSTDATLKDLQTDQWCLGRFGAVVVSTPTRTLLIGGVAADKLLDRRHEILDLDNIRFVEIGAMNRPLLTGFSAVDLGAQSDGAESDILILGGGATCFSFGTNWNDGCVLRYKAPEDDKTFWRTLTPPDTAPVSVGAEQKKAAVKRSTSKQDINAKSAKSKRKAIPRRSIESAAEFELIRNESRPVVLSGMDVGPCKDLWTNEYLKSKIGEARPVVVHSSPTPHMNFQTKNFSYRTQLFGSFIDAASAGEHLYLRALSAEKPSDKPTHLAEDFPSIAPNFQIPPALRYVQENLHSSPFRVSGPVTMWLHYDVQANILVQVRGHKRLLLFSPTEVTKLSFAPGASSSTINPFIDRHSAQAHEALLQPGDILYIPPFWLHAAEPTEGLSVAVNAFFKDAGMESAYAAGRDVYGNRDLAPYERGRRDVGKIVKAFEGLSGDVRKFYLGRLAEELRELSRT